MKATKSSTGKSSKRTTHTHVSSNTSKHMTDKYYQKKSAEKIMLSRKDLISRIARSHDNVKFPNPLKAPKI